MTLAVSDSTAPDSDVKDRGRLAPWSHACEPCRRADTEGWHGVEGAAHCAECHKTWRSQRATHCAQCCCHFSSYSASDLHDGLHGCLDPAEIPGLKLAADGFSWCLADQSRLPVSAASSGVAAPDSVAVAS